MFLILLSLIVVTIVFAIPMMRHRIASSTVMRTGIGKEDFSMKGESAEQSAARNPLKAFLVVVLPDGMIVTARVAGQA